MIPYGKQEIDQSDIDAVIDTLQSDWLTQGPKVFEFEQCIAKYCGAKYAVAVSNGTAALHLANLVIDKTYPKNVITTPITFLATSNSILYSDGTPVFVDIKKDIYTIDPKKVLKLLETGKKINGIIPVHLGGVICEMDLLYEIANKYGLWIIEDACHAIGGKWLDKKGNLRKVGDCAYSDMTIFSFHPVKQFTTGEGGAITTNNKVLYKKLLELRTHGMTKDSTSLLENHGPWYYEMHDLGYNYRMTDIQASLGVEQLKKNDEWVRKRRQLVKKYDEAFLSVNEVMPQLHPDINYKYSYHLYIVQCQNRYDLYEYLSKNNISTQVHYIPIHLQPFYKKKFKYNSGDFPIAENYYNNALSLPLYPGLTECEQNKVISLIKKFYEKN